MVALVYSFQLWTVLLPSLAVFSLVHWPEVQGSRRPQRHNQCGNGCVEFDLGFARACSVLLPEYKVEWLPLSVEKVEAISEKDIESDVVLDVHEDHMGH